MVNINDAEELSKKCYVKMDDVNWNKNK